MKLELIKPYEMQKPGTIISMPGGIASVLILNQIAKPATDKKEPTSKSGRKTK